MDIATLMGSMVFTVRAALTHMELGIARERIADSVAERRAGGKDLGGRHPALTELMDPKRWLAYRRAAELDSLAM